MTELGNGLSAAKRYEESLSVGEAELSMMRRVGVPEKDLLITNGNLACTYKRLGRDEEAIRMRREVYSGWLKLKGEECYDTLREASNYAMALVDLGRFKEAKLLLRKTIPVGRRALGESHEFTLKMRTNYARALYREPDATLDDLREAATTLEDTERTARRVLGIAHPVTGWIGESLQVARAILRVRETPLST